MPEPIRPTYTNRPQTVVGVQEQPTVQTVQEERAVEDSSISWRSVFAGALIALLTFSILTSLGVALGSAALKGVIQEGTSAGGLGLGSGIWMIVSTLISLFVGAHSASRASGLISSRVGGTQGVVITALFFVILSSGVGSTVGLLGRGIGSTVGAAGQAAGQAANNPQIQQVIQSSLGDLNLKSPPNVVAQQLGTRMMQGDTAGARDYLANQAGISPTEADQKIQSFKTSAQATLKDVGGTTAQAASIAGWTVFGALVLGTLFGWLGGRVGAAMNLSNPLGRGDRKAIRHA